MLNLIVNTTSRCNMACKYCYAKKYTEEDAISDETLEQLFLRTCELEGSGINFYWHGGEVLLLGLGFFKKVKKLQDEILSGKKYCNRIQTNGTLLNRKYARYFKKNDFRVGVSLDGPKEINDENRVFSNNKGTYDSIMKAVYAAKKENLHLGFLAVLTKKGVNKIDEIYQFFSENEFSFRLNPVLARLGSGFEPTPEEYGRALIRLYDLACNSDGKTKITPLESYEEMILSNEPIGCNQLLECYKRNVGVGCNGDVYNCNRFMGVTSKKLGNIHENSIEDIINSKRTEGLCKRDLNAMGCGECEWKNICNGGCPYSAYINYGTRDVRDYYCKAYKMIFSHISRRLAGGCGFSDGMEVCPAVLYEGEI